VRQGLAACILLGRPRRIPKGYRMTQRPKHLTLLITILCLFGGAVGRATGRDCPVATVLSTVDGFVMWMAREDEVFLEAQHKPFYRRSDMPYFPWLADVSRALTPMGGRLSFAAETAEGESAVGFECIERMHRDASRIEAAFRLEGGGLTMECLVPPEGSAVIVRVRSDGDGRLELVMMVEGPRLEARYTSPLESGSDFPLGAPWYRYEPADRTLRQMWDDRMELGSPRRVHDPCSALYWSLPCVTDLPAGLWARSPRPIQLRWTLGADAPLVLQLASADNPEELGQRMRALRSRDFDGWLTHTGRWCEQTLERAESAVLETTGVAVREMPDSWRRVFRQNLLELDRLHPPNGCLFACPAGNQLHRDGIAGYFNSWIRDDSIAVVNLAAIGLGECYLPGHIALMLGNHYEAVLADGATHRWWDTFYCSNDNCAGGTQFSETDSTFFGVWSLWEAGRAHGVVHEVSEAEYALCCDATRYLESSVTHDPLTGRGVRYFDERVGLFKEMRINEADITADEPDWYRYPVPAKGDRLSFVDTLYVNLLMHASYVMLGEMAGDLGRPAEAAGWLAKAAELAGRIDEHLWDQDKGRYIAGLGWHRGLSDYVPIDYDWYNIGFDYIWGLTLPRVELLPCSVEVRDNCLRAAYRDACWNNTVFAKAQLAVALAEVRCEVVEEIVSDCRTTQYASDSITGERVEYYFPSVIAEQFGGCNLPQVFAIAPTLRAMVLAASEKGLGR